MNDDDYMKIMAVKQEEENEYFFHLGYKNAIAYLQNISEKLECNSQLGDCLRDYLKQFDESHLKDRVYRDAYVTTEREAEEHLEYYLNGE